MTRGSDLHRSVLTSVAFTMHSSRTQVSPSPTGPVSSNAIAACISESLPLRPLSWLPPSTLRSRQLLQKLSFEGAMREARNTHALSGAAQLCAPLLERGPLFLAGSPSQS